MPRVTCSFCGLPFSVRQVRPAVDYFCCSGCALASRIPVNDGQLPVSPALIAALGIGFGLFNQVLFALLGGAVVAEGRVDVGGKLLWVSLGLGAIASAALVVLVMLARPRRWSDGVAALPSLALAMGAIVQVFNCKLSTAAWMLAAANGWFAAWLARGWLRRFVARRKRSSDAQDLKQDF